MCTVVAVEQCMMLVFYETVLCYTIQRQGPMISFLDKHASLEMQLIP